MVRGRVMRLGEDLGIQGGEGVAGAGAESLEAARALESMVAVLLQHNEKEENIYYSAAMLSPGNGGCRTRRAVK